MNIWQEGTIYVPDTVVLHNDVPYNKLYNEDNSAPDAGGGGWEELENDNLPEYLAIEDSLSTYEARRAAYLKEQAAARESALAKLKALGLTDPELKALGV